MLHQKLVIITVVIGFLIAVAGCEDVQKQPTTGRINNDAINQALKQENDLLKKKQDKLEKNFELMRIKVRELQSKQQAWIIFRNEVDQILEDLVKLGFQIKGNIIELPDQLFFKKGSADLSPKGESLLGDIARQLRRVNYIIRVEGHTDSIPVTRPMNKQLYKDNWGLSAARAASVIRYLNGPGNIPGERLMGVFFSKYRPLEQEEGKKGSAKNRRVEIRLVPPFVEAQSPLSLTEEEIPGIKTVIPVRSGDSFLNPGGNKKVEIKKPVKVKRPVTVKKEEPVGIQPKKEEPAVKVEEKEEEGKETVIIVN
jgi:chemotaxis protein MotB